MRSLFFVQQLFPFLLKKKGMVQMTFNQSAGYGLIW